MKKVLAVVLASAMAMSLTACSSQKPAETAAASVAETKAETTEAAGEETKAPEAGEEVTDLVDVIFFAHRVSPSKNYLPS